MAAPPAWERAHVMHRQCQITDFRQEGPLQSLAATHAGGNSIERMNDVCSKDRA